MLPGKLPPFGSVLLGFAQLRLLNESLISLRVVPSTAAGATLYIPTPFLAQPSYYSVFVETANFDRRPPLCAVRKLVLKTSVSYALGGPPVVPDLETARCAAPG
jgi:hypothetical protein